MSNCTNPYSRLSPAFGGASERQLIIELILIIVLCFAYALAELHLQLNHDVAWLLDAGSRWSHGERLYIDLIEVNPPLVFYLYWIITLGSWTKLAFIVGALASVSIMGAWVRRLAGPWWGIGSVIIVLATGAADFGQRDQFAVIATLPYLFAPSAKRKERFLIGIWAFAGLGLKPHLLIIPAAATLGRTLEERSIRSAFSPENLILGALCLLYLVAVWIAYPVFIEKMIPLGNLVYFAYGSGLSGELPIIYVVGIAIFINILAARHRKLWPFAFATIGAFLSYFIQGRFWSYHLVPAMALTSVLALLLTKPGTIRFAIVLGIVFLFGEWLFLEKRRHYLDLIPSGATTVLFLSPHVGSAYPAVIDHGVRHASHYPATWTIPGAWRLINEPSIAPEVRAQAKVVLQETRETIIGDILKYCPDPIFVDVRPRKPYFKFQFDFEKFIFQDARIRDYRPTKYENMYRIYRRNKPCSEAPPSNQN